VVATAAAAASSSLPSNITTSSHHHHHHHQDQDSHLMNKTDDHENNQIQIVLRDTSHSHHHGERTRIVKLTFSSEEDRDTMLHGLQTSLPYLKQQRFSLETVSKQNQNAATTTTRPNKTNDSTGENKANNTTTVTNNHNMAPTFKPSLVTTSSDHYQTGTFKTNHREKNRRRPRASY
jgi:hypothetical protein